MQETRHILQFSEIGGERRNPSTIEDGKFPRYNNTSGKFDYTCIGDGGDSDINISYFTDLITNIVEGTDTNTYLNAISRYGNYGKFTMSSGTNLYLALGALAWEDSVEADLILPGNTKVLYDNNDEIGGSAKFTYNYILNRLQLDSTPLMFKTGAESFKEGFKYLGNYSFSIGNSSMSLDGGSYNLTMGYRAGQTLSTSSAKNVIIGPYAGESIGNNVTDNILIGPYAGRFENSSSKFYLDNQNYGDAATGTNNSFLYADLDTERRLYIRDRLSVEKEGKFGTSGLLDAEGEYGMYQMSAETGGNPQWHDGTVWQDFANSTDTYLDDVTYSEGTLTFTLSDASTIGPIDISDINTTLFATSPSSPSTGQTGTSDYGYIQISDNSFTNNEGLTYKTGFKVNGNELLIPGSINLSSYTSSADNSIWTDGIHGYINLGGTAYQIDNDVLDAYYGVNIGGGTYEVFKQINGDNQFEFRTFRSTPIGSNNPNDRIKFSYSSDGDVIFIGTTAERNRLSTTIDDPATDVQIEKDNEGETLHIRALREGDNIVLTETANYIKIDAVTGGSGTLMDGAKLGTYNLFSQRNGTNLEFFGVNTTDPRISLTQGVTDVEFALNLEISGSNETPSTSKTYSGSVFSTVATGTGINPKIWFKPIISNSINITDNANELILETDAGSASNIGAGTLEVYNTGSSLPFEFKTISNTGNHFSGEETGGLIEFNVDDIVLTNLGTGVYSITQDVDDSFKFSQKAFTEGYAISLDNDTNLIEIGVSELIPQFSFTTTPVYTSGLLEFKANYSNDIVNTAPAATTLFEINIGDGLVYTPATNTLSTNQANVGTGTDYALRDVSVSSDTATEKIYSLEITDGLTTVENTFDIVIPKYQLPIATYTDDTGSDGTLGGVKVYENVSTWGTTNDTEILALDDVTGKLYSTPYVITYLEQNNLYDADNVGNHAISGLPFNTHRQYARANIGAAYVNGSLTEDFNAKDLNVEGILSALERIQTHQIGGVQITGTTIDSDGIILTMRQENGTKITLFPGVVNVTLADTSSPSFNVFRSDGQRMLKLDVNTGDLYVYGSLRVGGTIEAFDTDAQNI